MRRKYIVFWLALFTLLMLFLQATGKYHFFYIEQLQLFQFSGDYLVEKIVHPGGLALLVAEFLTQFFLMPWMGPILVAALLTGVGVATEVVVRRIAPGKRLFAFALLPSLCLLLVGHDFNYLLQGTVAYLLALLCLGGVARVGAFRCRVGVALCVCPLLFWAAGPVAGLFALSLLIYELLLQRRKGLLMAVVVLEFALIALGAVLTTVATDFSFALLPDAYYHPVLEAPSVLYFSWLCLPFCMIAVSLYPSKLFTSTKGRWAEVAIQTIAIAAIAFYSIPRYNDAKSYIFKTLDYYTRTEQWERIIEQCRGSIKNYLYLNCLNRALAERGELADRFFTFDQRGPQGLLATWNKMSSVSTLLSDTYFTLGEIALSQKMAFEAHITVIGSGNPRSLQRLVQTNLIYGSYTVAEKYIRILENTYAYRDWAQKHRLFLNNDTAIEKDPLLGAKRRGLTKQSDLAGVDGLEADLLSRAEQNPSDKLPIHFTGVSYLLAKDMKSFKALIEKYYGTPVLPSLPVSFQEAVILLSERDREYWARFDISDAVVRRFTDYRALVMQNRSNTQLPQLIQRSFGNTYWAYYTLK